MPPPSQLAIATSSVSRLLKEEASYHKELVDQEAQVQKLEQSIKNGGGDEDGNAEFMLKQNVCLPLFFFRQLFFSFSEGFKSIFQASSHSIFPGSCNHLFESLIF